MKCTLAFALLAQIATIVALKPTVPRGTRSKRFLDFKTPLARQASPLDESIPSSNVGEIAAAATDLCVTVMRVGTCALMYHHGIDKIEVSENPFMTFAFSPAPARVRSTKPPAEC